MALIELTDIKKSYQDGENHQNNVLRGINIDIEKGEFVAIKGASGSGKTTLLSILGTLLQADSGTYRLNGAAITTNNDHAEIRNKQIGFVFQNHQLMPQYTVLENILLPTLANTYKTNTDAIEYALELMKLTRITAIAKQYPDTISGGEASRVAVCRALIMKPLLLLADEPTGQLDAENAGNIATLLAEINKHLQTTIVMVTHSDDTSSVAHHILTLNKGLLQ